MDSKRHISPSRALALWAALCPCLFVLACGPGEEPLSGVAEPPAKTTETAPVTERSAGAKLRFKNLTHDFGKVDDTDELKHDFEFKNEGSETLQIFEVKPSCGCTTTGLKKMVYEPGEEGAIELLFHPKGYGSQTKTITIKSNSKGSERITLYIKSQVTPFVQFEPR